MFPAATVRAMADDDRPDFDFLNLLQGPAAMMTGMRGLADNGRKAVTGLLDTIASLQRAAAALEALAARVDQLVTELETPLRLLSPELEKAANRVLRVAEIMEGPIDRLLPGLEQAVDTFDRLSLNQLPDNLDALRSQVATVVDVFGELPRKLGLLGGLGAGGFGAVTQLFPGLERLATAASRLASGGDPDQLLTPVVPLVGDVVKRPTSVEKATKATKATKTAKVRKETKTAKSALPKAPTKAVKSASTKASKSTSTKAVQKTAKQVKKDSKPRPTKAVKSTARKA